MGKKGQTEGLTAIQERFLVAYIATHNVSESCRQTGMKGHTARRLVVSEAFQAALRVEQNALFERALDGLRSNVDKAIDTLVRHMDNDTTPPGAQIRAAQIYLEQAVQLHKMSELEARLTEMERAIKERAEVEQ